MFWVIHWLIVHPLTCAIVAVAPRGKYAQFYRAEVAKRRCYEAQFERNTGKRMPWHMRETVREWFE